MRDIKARRLWTGQGGTLENARVTLDREGLVEGIAPLEPEDFPEYDFVMPAFFDAHCHLSWMVLKELSLDLSTAGSAEDLLGIVWENARAGEDGIIRGDSFDESSWSDSRLPTLDQLDAVTGNRPAFLCRVCGHAALANSAMMALMEHDPKWMDRETGFLRERPVMEFSEHFPPDREKAREAVVSVTAKIHSTGVTGVCTVEKPANALDLIEAAPDLDIAWVVNGDGPSPELPGQRMRKFFLDGSFGAGNAAVDPYSRENLLHSDDELLRGFLACAEAGEVPVIHAIGAGALAQLQRVSARAFDVLGRGFPVRIEHGEDLEPVWDMGWDPDFHIFSMQPNFVERWQRPGGMYDRLLPPGRSVRLNPFRLVLDGGFSLGFGSDSMPLDPIFGLRGALRHRDALLALDTHEALRAYTLSSAEISGCGHLAASLAPGRPGDLVCLDGDPFSDFDSVSVQRTVRRGRTVFRREEAAGEDT
ncbi:MAG TPA: amidohydrolase family protein [Candidatus Sabulitectum sp.]|nr:amidohydrolase family protein [Candidatus Sabulitectum sp.]HPJ27507.1 amidohydrolase family protein [Candidatus Sabulitectum sp.]